MQISGSTQSAINYKRLKRLTENLMQEGSDLTSKGGSVQAASAIMGDSGNISRDDILKKLNAGQTLSRSELDYLRKNDPELYRGASEAKRASEEQARLLKRCKTKQEVQNLCLVLGIDMGALPEQASAQEQSDVEKWCAAAVSNVTQEFLDSEEYKFLPEKASDPSVNTDRTEKPVKVTSTDEFNRPWEQAHFIRRA